MKIRTYKYYGAHGEFKYQSRNKRKSTVNYDDFCVGWKRRFQDRCPSYKEYTEIASGAISEYIVLVEEKY